MKSTPLIINWHDQNAPVYSAHFEQGGKGRLATAGGDNNVRLWKVERNGEERKVEYLSTLVKHTQAVNVVRWAPKGEVLASAGDDGNVIVWVPSETHQTAFGSEGLEDKETWRARHMCRSSGAEIYDLAWSPDGNYFIIGSMDNIARIYNSQTGYLVRQIAEHSHYVQGVAWDPLNEYIATQSSDRSVHIYSLKNKDGQYTLTSHDDGKTAKLVGHMKCDMPPRRAVVGSPALSDAATARGTALASVEGPVAAGSPAPSAPGTPMSMALPMNPPSGINHSRRSSFSSRRSMSPAPSMPLPAVMPMTVEASPKPLSFTSSGSGVKNAMLYANETLTSFFRRLTFTPDGSLLLTPSGQYQTQHQPLKDMKPSYEIVNTVYIYSRGGINKPPVAHLPGHKKPSVAVRCSPIIYTLRNCPQSTKNITIDTSSSEEAIPPLPESVASTELTNMEPPAKPTAAAAATTVASNLNGPPPAFILPYRMVYAVATQDSVLIYDTQQMTPICVVSNLHCATFTDLAWSVDGSTLLITSSDGFCSTLSFAPGELGTIYTGEIGKVATVTSVPAPPSPFHGPRPATQTPSIAPLSPNALSFNLRGASPAHSVASTASSVAASTGKPLIAGAVPSLTASSASKGATGVITTPPETPHTTSSSAATSSNSTTATVAAGSSTGVKREAGAEEGADTGKPKKRRIAPTLVQEFGKPDMKTT
ncbi:Chromatin assembly factor 1 subunit [Ceratocystis pirilliformis]|uniref:Chromatin assembly factor 1 subunit n=1 Tax=Ceratocystis pirilliformis TaxID=259994 RepID=A0ABR3YTS7_9PEZI